MTETLKLKLSNTNVLIVKLICSLIFTLFIGCKNYDEENLCKKNNFWYTYRYDTNSDSFRIINYGYKFYRNKVDIMSYSFDINELSELVIDDVYIPKDWYIDSSKRILHFKSDDYEILYHKQDTILIRDPPTGKRFLLINCGGVNPKKLPQSYRIKQRNRSHNPSDTLPTRQI